MFCFLHLYMDSLTIHVEYICANAFAYFIFVYFLQLVLIIIMLNKLCPVDKQ